MLPFSLATTLPSGACRGSARLTIDLDGSQEPLRGPLPRAGGSFPGQARMPRRRSRVPHAAIVTIGRARAAAPRLPNRAAAPAGRERISARAFVPVGRPAPARPRPHPIRAGRPRITLPPAPRRRAMPLRHKLMLALAAEVLVAGTARARQEFRPPAILIEDAGRDGHRIALLETRRASGATAVRLAVAAARKPVL
ncbi:hypothetical protein [Methylobacterium nodulans]|uniref:Uncharacterized protein n=1 Tax=Methylobacterium nodulans (strain LMG 21967 / CNCM I-2342 / ORS 2060) TaxID=460265 RepID=B8IL51_METNO|nr:hypothetical protein [Methylobacterium nodulans]ACL58239.1 conserved hypothetical protein [Methylobacterium nodulans ORS 2060]